MPNSVAFCDSPFWVLDKLFTSLTNNIIDDFTGSSGHT